MNTTKFLQLLILCVLAFCINSGSLKAQVGLKPDCNCSSPSTLSAYCKQYCISIGALTVRDTADIRNISPEFASQIQYSINEIDENISALKKELELWENLKNVFQSLNNGLANDFINKKFKKNNFDKNNFDK